MIYEKIIRRANGARVKLSIELLIDRTQARRFITVETCQPNKRTWVNAHNKDDYGFRRLKTQEEKGLAILTSQLKHVTLAEINQACLELWQGFKPSPITMDGIGETVDSLVGGG